MTRQEAAKLLPIIQAFSEGKTIQRIEKYNGMDCAVDIKSNDINFDNYSSKYYRIKPSPTYRPFANAEECWNEMLKHKPFGWCKTEDGCYYPIISVDDGDDFNSSFNSIRFADGSVFGIKEEE